MFNVPGQLILSRISGQRRSITACADDDMGALAGSESVCILSQAPAAYRLKGAPGLGGQGVSRKRPWRFAHEPRESAVDKILGLVPNRERFAGDAERNYKLTSCA